jgi:hypothetical protein
MPYEVAQAVWVAIGGGSLVGLYWMVGPYLRDHLARR